MMYYSLTMISSSVLLLWVSVLLAAPHGVEPFAEVIHPLPAAVGRLRYQKEAAVRRSTTGSTGSSSSALFLAKKKKKSRKPTAGAGSSFGGMSMEPCPCGSKETYSKCCGKLHRDVNAYKSASAEQVVRARYSAYAKKQPEFLMASTHPLHKDFDTDIKRWKETIKQNMYDNFDLTQCAIVKEEYPTDDTAEVQFIAHLILRETGELTAFMETSQFERAKTHGGWLYKNGTISAVPGAEGESDDNEKTEEKSSEKTMEKLKELL